MAGFYAKGDKQRERGEFNLIRPVGYHTPRSVWPFEEKSGLSGPFAKFKGCSFWQRDSP